MIYGVLLLYSCKICSIVELKFKVCFCTLRWLLSYAYLHAVVDLILCVANPLMIDLVSRLDTALD